MNKKIGIIGLGKMGKNMTERLLEKNWQVVGFDLDKTARKEIVNKGAKAVETIEDLVKNLASPRLVWIMVPHPATEETLHTLSLHIEKGDFIIDGGNSFYEFSEKRGKEFEQKGINFIDVGVSGGPSGARNGACLMIGGKEESFENLKPLFEDLAREGKSFEHFEGYGAGHFVKMVHNGIEYGIMQAIAEGFNLMKESPYKLDLERVANIYNQGSVIESRLVAWLKGAFEQHGQELEEVKGSVSHTGEGEWTIKTAKKLGVPVKVIEDSFQFRVESEKNPSYTGKILSALREQFGGHAITK